MPIVDYDPILADFRRRETEIAYAREQAKALFVDGTGRLALLADEPSNPTPGWTPMTPAERIAAMETALREHGKLADARAQRFLTETVYHPDNPIVKINTPSYDKRTNYHVAGLASCGVDIVKLPSLDDSADPQYLHPRYGDSGELVGGAFFVKNA